MWVTSFFCLINDQCSVVEYWRQMKWSKRCCAGPQPKVLFFSSYHLVVPHNITHVLNFFFFIRPHRKGENRIEEDLERTFIIQPPCIVSKKAVAREQEVWSAWREGGLDVKLLALKEGEIQPKIMALVPRFSWTIRKLIKVEDLHHIITNTPPI